MAPLPPVLAEDVFIPGDPGFTLYLRNKRAAGVARFSPGRTVLMVHGATYPSHVMFDAALDGCSWMDRLAARGFDVWALDLRGYGKSTRPAQMSAPPAANPPFCLTDEAKRDVAAALAHIRKTRKLDRVALIGWSWGTVIAGSYAADHPGEIERLVLLAPLWLREGASAIFVPPGPLGAYRAVPRAAAKERWLGGIP
ncbi:MAG: alpha/beta hydrolase, partial [Alphaproteobacteria bacterium]|nr:alpha/beta hydrolase [Alphaproteobacteria bacterium]